MRPHEFGWDGNGLLKSSYCVAGEVGKRPNYGTTAFEGSAFASLQLVSAVDNTPLLPTTCALQPSVPNPFNPQTAISFKLPIAAEVQLKIYSVSGRRIKTLISNGACVAGRHTVIWNGQDDAGHSATSGVYFYRIVTKDYQAINRLTLLK